MPLVTFLVQLVLLFTHLPEARAGDTADEAELHFELGAEAYRSGNYRAAVEHFLVSNRLSPNSNVTYNIARAFEKLERYPEAYRYYQASGSAEGQAALATIAPRVAVLEVESTPPGATLYVDRVDLGPRGEAPRSLGLAPGKYRIIAEKDGYRRAEVEVPEVSAGQRREVHVVLEPLLGRVAVVGTNLTGATVSARVAGERLSCAAPCSLALPPGPTTLLVERAGFRATDLVVEVRPDQETRVVARLEPSLGELSVEADETGALIEIDGKPAGYTPAMLRLPVGRHQLRVTYPGTTPALREVTIVEGQAERVALELTRIDQVTAASRRKESTLEAPSSVTVIPREELQLFSYPTVLEAVRGAPGVFQWDDRAYPTIGVRGHGRLGSYGNHVLLLLDDHAMNDSWAGSSYAGYQHRTDLADVERIEIVRGPGSVLYGTNAFAGVVNVVTRAPEPTTRTEIGASVAQEGVGRVRARQDVRLGKDTALWVSGAYGRSAGNVYEFERGEPNELLFTEAQNDSIETMTAEMKFTHRSLTVTGFATTAEKHVAQDYYVTILDDPRNTNRDTRGFVEARLEPQLTEELQSVTIVHADTYVYEGVFPRTEENYGIEEDSFDGYWAGLEQRFVYRPFDVLEVTAGGVGQYHFRADQHVTYDGVASLDERRNVYVGAGYGMVDVYLPRVHISGGLRYDAYGTSPRDCAECSEATFGSSANPRVAVVVDSYADGKSKLMIGKAFRAPSVSEMFYSDGGVTQAPSADLGPEEMWSFELQHVHQFSRLVSASVSAYVTRTTGQVIDAAVSSDDPFYYENSDVPLATAGIELRLRREWSQGWMLEGSYSLQAATYLASDGFEDLVTWDQSQDYQDVANVPGHMASVKGAVPIWRRLVTLGSKVTVESGRSTWQEVAGSGDQSKTAVYALWDLVLGGEESHTGIRYTLGVYNVFDTRYELPVGVEFVEQTMPQLGRSFLADVSVRF